MLISNQKLLGIVFIAFLLLALGQIASIATPPQPTYGTAVVDGNIGEWNLTTDFFANMYRTGNPSNKLESKANTPPEPSVLKGDPAIFKYVITNTGNYRYTANRI